MRGRAVRQVYANDLNPASHRWLIHNIALNKVRGCQASAFSRFRVASAAEQTELSPQMHSYMKVLSVQLFQCASAHHQCPSSSSIRLIMAGNGTLWVGSRDASHACACVMCTPLRAAKRPASLSA